jgi:putative membrane protein
MSLIDFPCRGGTIRTRDPLRPGAGVQWEESPYGMQSNSRYHRCMRGWFIHWILSGVALLVVANILPGIQVESFGSALIAALVIGLVSATVGLILKVILLPFILLSLGIVYFLINGLMLELASALVPGFRVSGFLTAVIGSILLTLVDYVLNRLAGM